VRFGLPLMVLTSLSIHVILLLIWLLQPGSASGVGKNPGPVPGPVVIISHELAPDSPPPPAHPTAPPPSHAAPAVAKALPKPQPIPVRAVDPDTVLAGGGGPHLNGGVVFILDISGSMYEAYGGATRLALARKFLDRQIAALPDGTPFAITLYGETTRSSGPLVPANRMTRVAAAHYLGEDYDLGGGTNLPAGLDAAEALRPAGVVIVTDGDLNIADSKLMSEARRILGQPGPQMAIFAVAPRRGTGDAELLQELARQQIGTYQAMDVPRARQTDNAVETGTEH
jgi:hypothetical protein